MFPQKNWIGRLKKFWGELMCAFFEHKFRQKEENFRGCRRCGLEQEKIRMTRYNFAAYKAENEACEICKSITCNPDLHIKAKDIFVSEKWINCMQDF